jgi:hypothetical protein
MPKGIMELFLYYSASAYPYKILYNFYGNYITSDKNSLSRLVCKTRELTASMLKKSPLFKNNRSSSINSTDICK